MKFLEKLKSTTAVSNTSSIASIQNKKQWFLMLNDLSKDISQYEKHIIQYNNKTGRKLDLSRPLCKGFYKNDNKVNYTIRRVLKYIPASLIAGAVIWLVAFIVSVCTTDMVVSTIGDIFAQAGTKSAIIASIFAFLAFLITSALIGWYSYTNITSMFKQFDKEEANLVERLSTVPPSYRTSEKLDVISQVYFTRQNLPFKAIFEVCDDWFVEHKSKFHSLMFDIDYMPLFDDNSMYQLGTTDKMTAPTVEEKNPALKNPNLPADIESKTFEGSKDSKKDLDAMIGLESVKQQIKKLANRMKFYGNSNNNGNHMTFLGSAGTGKTTVARIVTKILFDLGYIKKNQYVEISGDYLKSGSSARASAIMDYAMGGVLFIDEAYLLYDKNGYSAEATGILLKAMEDRRSDFVVILAGYEEQMTRLIASNEGFSSRIKHTIYFPDYTVDEMIDIFNYFISDYNGKRYELDIAADSVLRTALEAESKAKSFGNARTVRNAVDAIMDYYADRCISTKNHSNKILEEDVSKYYEDRKKFLQHELKNSSAANQIDESIIRLAELKPKLKDGSENPEEDFNNLVGMEDLRQEIEMLKNQKEFYNEIQHQKILMIGDCSYNKDAIMKALTGSLYELGYITENKYLDISAEFMKGSYVGHTSKRAESIISYASGGVLAISNLNLLVDSSDTFGQEVISIIITALNENPDVTIVILDNNSDFIESSIKNLCTIIYELPEYNSEQFYQIFMQFANNDGFSIEENALNKIQDLINTSIHSVNDVNNFYNTVKKNHIANFNGIDNKFVIIENDVSLTKAPIKLKLNTRR